MAIHNYLIEGVSGSGKSSVYKELKRRNYYATEGDTLAEFRNPENGEPTSRLSSKLSARLIQSLANYSGSMVYISHDPIFSEGMGADAALRLPDGHIERGY